MYFITKMENAKEWAIENPQSSIFFLALMLKSPIEKIVLPYLSAQIIENLHNSRILVSKIIHWIIVFVILNICHYLYEHKKHSIVTELNDKYVQILFTKIMNSEWSVSDNDVFELLSIIQSSNSYSWKIVNMASSLLGSHIFLLLGTVYIFFNNATWYVVLILMTSIAFGVLTVHSAVENCRDDIKQYNSFKLTTLSNIADMISSRSLIDKSQDKNKFIKPTLDSLSRQNEKEFSCRIHVSTRIGLVSALTTSFVYFFLFSDLLQQNISYANFTTLFFVSQHVFEIPLSLEGLLYENMLLNVFESDTQKRFQPKKNYNIRYSNDVKVMNVKIKYLPIDQAPVDIRIKQGHIVSLSGPNGCGKSSLLRIIAGLEAPLNDDAVIMSPKNSMYVPQNANLVNQSIIENIGLGFYRNPTEEEVVKILADNNLKSYFSVFQKFMHIPVGELGKKLSGGQRQIVWMLRLIFSGKKVAFLDEPTSWMSSRVTEAYLNCLRRNKMTALIVTHDRTVQAFADVELDWDDVTSRLDEGGKNSRDL